MKKWVLLMLLAGAAQAQTPVSLTLPVIGTVDLGTLAQNAGGIVAYDNHGRKWAGASLRLAWYPQDPTNAWTALEGGVLWDTATGAPSGVFAAIGIRGDTLYRKTGLGTKIGTLPIPAFEFGPFGSYLTNQRQLIFGGFLSKKWG